jgi:hypothetical protein
MAFEHAIKTLNLEIDAIMHEIQTAEMHPLVFVEAYEHIDEKYKLVDELTDAVELLEAKNKPKKRKSKAQKVKPEEVDNNGIQTDKQ